MEELREHARSSLCLCFQEVDPGRQRALASELELATFAEVSAGAGTEEAVRPRYLQLLGQLQQVLRLQDGDLPTDAYASRYARGEVGLRDLLAAHEAVAALRAAGQDPRVVVRRLFIRHLLAAEAAAGGAAVPMSAPELGRALELSCYNATIRASKNSEEPARRQWDSDDFVNIYSGRAGTVASMLDPAGVTVRQFGPRLYTALATGALSAQACGELDPKQVYPESVAAERAEIDRRREQHVQEKETNLFKCPHCGERRSTYRQVQRRCLDEAPDYICRCLACKRRFMGVG